MKTIVLVVLLACLAVPALALEKDYQNKWCEEEGGITEVVLSDNTRIDCDLPEQVVEFDFAHKWAEAIGQSLHYAQMTDKQAKIVLIFEPGDEYHLLKLMRTLVYHKLDIDVEIVPK